MVLAERIGRFIELGAGLPASPAVHQTARAVLPSARVVYVDNDSVVLAHSRALLAKDEGVAAVAADLRDPATVLADPQLRPLSISATRCASSLPRSCTSSTPMPPGR